MLHQCCTDQHVGIKLWQQFTTYLWTDLSWCHKGQMKIELIITLLVKTERWPHTEFSPPFVLLMMRQPYIWPIPLKALRSWDFFKYQFKNSSRKVKFLISVKVHHLPKTGIVRLLPGQRRRDPHNMALLPWRQVWLCILMNFFTQAPPLNYSLGPAEEQALLLLLQLQHLAGVTSRATVMVWDRRSLQLSSERHQINANVVFIESLMGSNSSSRGPISRFCRTNA